MEQLTNVPLKELDYFHVVQPIIDLTTMQILGFEMLLRSKQIKNPAILFQQAKLQNQMFDLDMYSIQLVLQTVDKHKEWFHNYHIFINILPATLSNPNAFHKIKRLTTAANMYEKKLVFEVTEDASESELMLCKVTLTDMKREGYLIAMDDLGKGDSTLADVSELNPHVIELDKLFAENLATSKERQRQMKHLVHLFSKDRLLILEGVEKEADLKMAKQLGIRYVQGFYLGKPERLRYYQNKTNPNDKYR